MPSVEAMLTMRADTALLQVGQGQTREAERGLDVHRPEFVELRFAALVEIHLPPDAGVVDQRVQFAEMMQGAVHPGGGRVGLARLEVFDDEVVPARIGEHLAGAVDVADAQGQPVAVGQEARGDGRADAPATRR